MTVPFFTRILRVKKSPARKITSVCETLDANRFMFNGSYQADSSGSAMMSEQCAVLTVGTAAMI